MVRKIGDFMKLVHIVNKNDETTFSNIKCKIDKKLKKYEFFLDNIRNCIYITDRLVYTRESDEYKFNLEISDNSKCNILLKEENLSFDIKVLSSSYCEKEDVIDFTYKLETDEIEHKIKLENGD